MESIEFLHANHIFTVTFEDDLAFTEVRAILDYLLERNAFSYHVQEHRPIYEIDLEKTCFKVWVSEMQIIVLKQ